MKSAALGGCAIGKEYVIFQRWHNAEMVQSRRRTRRLFAELMAILCVLYIACIAVMVYVNKTEVAQARAAAFAEVRAALLATDVPGPRPKRISLPALGIDAYVTGDHGATRSVIIHDRW